MDNANKSQRKLEWIAAQWAAGRTVYASTYLRRWCFSAKAAKTTGAPFFRVGAHGALLMLEGYTKQQPRYVDASHCKLAAR